MTGVPTPPFSSNQALNSYAIFQGVGKSHFTLCPPPPPPAGRVTIQTPAGRGLKFVVNRSWMRKQPISGTFWDSEVSLEILRSFENFETDRPFFFGGGGQTGDFGSLGIAALNAPWIRQGHLARSGLLL